MTIPNSTAQNLHSPLPLEKALLYTLWAIAFTAPLLRWLWHTGNPLDYFTYNAPIGQIPYLLSKLMALFALSLLVMQFLLMLLRRKRILSGRSVKQHAFVGIGILVFATAHIVLFVAAKSLRAEYLAWETVLPNFGHGYYKSMLSVGSLGFLGLMLTIAAGLKSTKSKKTFNLMHKISYLSFGIIFVHLLSIGSEI